MTFNFDFRTFRALLAEAAHTAFVEVQRKYADEHFYAFALYTSGEIGYVVPTANTEEGLARVASRYVSDGYGPDLQAVAAELRWNPDDWAYHLEGAELFEAVNNMLVDVPARLFELYRAGTVWLSDAMHAEFECSLVGVLQELDQEGVFGRGEARRRVVINLLMGDQSNESRLANAGRLNPPDVWERLKTDLPV